MVRKNLRNVWVDDYNVRSFSISFCVFALNTFAEIIFLKHVRIFLHSLHIAFLSFLDAFLALISLMLSPLSV